MTRAAWWHMLSQLRGLPEEFCKKDTLKIKRFYTENDPRNVMEEAVTAARVALIFRDMYGLPLIFERIPVFFKGSVTGLSLDP